MIEPADGPPGPFTGPERLTDAVGGEGSDADVMGDAERGAIMRLCYPLPPQQQHLMVSVPSAVLIALQLRS